MLIIFQAQVEMAKLKTEAMLAGKSITVRYFTMFKRFKHSKWHYFMLISLFKWRMFHYGGIVKMAFISFWVRYLKLAFIQSWFYYS